MTDFEIWFPWGVRHILDVSGYDHVLFIALLAISFPIKEWKKLFGLITAFTVGHSVTLILSTLQIINVRREYCELLIALTILATALNVLFNSKNTPKRVMYLYLIICLFGLIHGMGFSYVVKMAVPQENILHCLFYFNIGIEVGQIMVVIFVLCFSLLLSRALKIPFNSLQEAYAIIAGLFSLALCVPRIIDIYNS